MRTTIRLDDTLLRRAKAEAAARGRSLNDFIADAVRAALAPRASAGVAIPIPTFKGGGGLLPGVDLDDSAALLDVMEGQPTVTYDLRSPSRRVAEKSKKRRT